MSSLVLEEGNEVDADDEQLVASLVVDHSEPPSSDHDKEAEAALDSFLETTVAEVNLALSHDDAVTAAVNAAALDATADVSVVVDQIAVTAAAAAADAITERVELLTPEEHQANLVKNLNMNTIAVGTAGSPNHGESWSSPASNRTSERVGRWTLDEKILFLYGLQKFGKGQWKKISAYVPGRSLVQIKSHAQKVLKRLSSGENVFLRIEENISRLFTLVNQIHETLGLDPPSSLLQPSTFSLNIAESPRKTKNDESKNAGSAEVSLDDDGNDAKPKKRARTKASKDGTEHLAASALCQLADEDNPENDGVSNENAEISINETAASGDDLEIGVAVGI